VNYQTLADFETPEEQARYLTHFRADSIVKDAELIREALVGNETRWSVLGQSYGGFCLVHYLSVAAHALREALFTGGLPSLDRTADEVYRATFRRVVGKNEKYYERYPDDAERAWEILDYLNANDVGLPGGGRLTPRRFQQLGIAFGASDGFEKVHYLLEEAFVTTGSGQGTRELNYSFLRGFENAFSFETNPIYALMHESIYCQESVSAWAAERVGSEFREFALVRGQPPYFKGEMIYPWMFDDYAYLRPLKKVAQILAHYDRWPRLYDVDVLRGNRVPCAAAVYYDDMYVERAFSEESASTIGGMKVWVTNEYEHNALRVDGDKVLDRLLGMLKGTI
jgi:hypothetical protein